MATAATTSTETKPKPKSATSAAAGTKGKEVARAKPNYQHNGTYYDWQTFLAEFNAQFGKSGRYNAGCVPDLQVLLRMMQSDTGLTDVRQLAYMMATVMWETTSPTTVTEAAVDKKGRPLVDKKTKQPIMVQRKKWQMTMAPVNEVGEGKGRRYHEPVKVKQLADGGVRITEQDGDQFHVSPTGAITNLTKKAKMGSRDGAAATKVYEKDDGTELAYFGRGYVQLTWWSNYVKAGIAIGRGLDLLLDPELVKSPEIAYALMSHGMRTGAGFANGHKLSDYFAGDNTNYVGARRMVNGNDHASDIGALAQKFESALLKARNAGAQPATRLQLP